MRRANEALAFTDTYFPTVNGVTYMVDAWKRRWNQNYGKMYVYYPGTDEYDGSNVEYPVRSLPFPFYQGYRVPVPFLSASGDDPDVVHVHSPFSLGLAGLWVSRQRDVPLIASYHTPTEEYASYLSSISPFEELVGWSARRYERWFYSKADIVLAPTVTTKEYLTTDLEVDTTVEVVPNGVDLDRFEPKPETDILERHGVDADGLVIGYTGRHGYEKDIDDLIRCAEGLDVTLVIGGDGPANDDLRELGRNSDADVVFAGFFEEEELPEFYSAIDLFVHPSTVETSGLVALEACACGTPVVAADDGALQEVVGETVPGATFEPGNIPEIRTRVRQALRNREQLRQECLATRETLSIDKSTAKLRDVYDRYCNAY